MAGWPPITITLTTQGATIATAGVHTATIPAGPTVHTDAMRAAARIAATYRRPLPVTATGPEGVFAMVIDPDGTIHTDEEAPHPPEVDPAAEDRGAPEDGHPSETEELAVLPPVLNRTARLPPQPHTVVVTAGGATPSGAAEQVPDRAAAPKPPARPATRPRRLIAVLAALALTLTASALAWQAITHSHTPPTTSAPSPSWPIPEPMPPSPHQGTPSPTPITSPSREPASPSPQESTPPPETVSEPETPEPQLQPEPQPPDPAPTEEAPQTPNQPARGITAMNTTVATSEGGTATITATLQGSGPASVAVNVGGASTTITIQAPGTGSATLSAIPQGAQPWSASCQGLVNSGTVTVY
jgi:hypothetical protein